MSPFDTIFTMNNYAILSKKKQPISAAFSFILLTSACYLA
ncbi:hypothetical protein PMSV_2286 [Photobacterium leiognathi subsp. mandapamensis svers.1.1.]|nr:hypothetical protein PMSV_2286 [Photobacterium leiognathi subsp. mandapamensis svers.1.1.]